MTPIFVLTLSQLIRRRRYIVVLLLAAVPIVLALIYYLSSAADRPDMQDFHDVLTAQVLNSVVLPISALLLATATLGDEIEDRTLNYLTLKPIARWRIVVPKILATCIAVALPVVFAGIVMSLIITEGDLPTSLVTGAGLAVGAAAYSTVFVWGGLVSRQMIVFGLIYVFIWEVSISTLFSGLRYVSIRQYALGVIHGLDAARLSDVANSGLGLAPAILGAAIVVVLFGWLTDRRLRLMDIP
jgi:ABC-2 type transport system permease protein